MAHRIVTTEIRYEHDVVFSRQRARQIASLLGFDAQDQTRIATAVSEVARNAFQYAGGGKVEYDLADGPPLALRITVSDCGAGFADLQAVLDGRYVSHTGMGLGIVGARRLMDELSVTTGPTGSTVTMAKHLGPRLDGAGAQSAAAIAESLARITPNNPYEEIQQQNQELVRALEDLRRSEEELRIRNEELGRLNQELADTNRGVVALYAELDERADYLQRANEVKTRFLSNMSHEFRTPLNAVLSLSQMLLDRLDGELTPEQERQATYIRRSAEDLSELINDLLDLAKVEAGKVVVRPRVFEVADLFGALRGMLRPLLAANAAVSLQFDEPVGIPALQTDEGKVSQILRNFLSNALKFTEHGEVRVSAHQEREGFVTFAVADTGIGIAPADHERIFQEYTQIESPQQARVKGTGLGLPLSRKLAEMLGGSVSMQSEPGVGSVFSVTLPGSYMGPSVADYGRAPASRVEPGRLPILVVEDNREVLFIYERYLRDSTYQLIPAHTLADARRLLTELRPAAIVLDILLDGESTWELLTELKRQAVTRGVPVVVATVVDNRKKALRMGADAFAVKPVARDWLLDTLSSLTASSAQSPVLIVDDDEVARYLLREQLGGFHCNVREEPDGARGLARALADPPRAILLDLALPDISGFEVLRRLKADPATAPIPVVVCTSRSLSQADREALADAEAIVSKDSITADGANPLRTALASIGLAPVVVGESR